MGWGGVGWTEKSDSLKIQNFFVKWSKCSKIDGGGCTYLQIWKKQIVHFKWVKYMVYKVHANKGILKKNQ